MIYLHTKIKEQQNLMDLEQLFILINVSKLLKCYYLLNSNEIIEIISRNVSTTFQRHPSKTRRTRTTRIV